MPSVMAARWVGQNSGPIFRRLWTKVHRIKFPCAGVSVVCNAVFDLAMSIVAFRRYLRSRREVVRNRAEIFMFRGREGATHILQNFINLGHRRTCGKVC